MKEKKKSSEDDELSIISSLSFKICNIVFLISTNPMSGNNYVLGEVSPKVRRKRNWYMHCMYAAAVGLGEDMHFLL